MLILLLLPLRLELRLALRRPRAAVRLAARTEIVVHVHVAQPRLRVIAAAHVERQAPPVSAARRRLSEVYGATRLARRLEQERRTA